MNLLIIDKPVDIYCQIFEPLPELSQALKIKAYRLVTLDMLRHKLALKKGNDPLLPLESLRALVPEILEPLLDIEPLVCHHGDTGLYPLDFALVHSVLHAESAI